MYPTLGVVNEAGEVDGKIKKVFRDKGGQISEDGGEVITHFFSPNPFEGGTIRAVWQHSRDTSTVWTKLHQPNGSAKTPATRISEERVRRTGRHASPVLL